MFIRNSDKFDSVALRRHPDRMRASALLSGVTFSALMIGLTGPIGGAAASDCGGGGAVVGGNCTLQPYDPAIDENGGTGANATNNDLDPVTVTNGETVTLTGNAAVIQPGEPGVNGATSLFTFDTDGRVTAGAEFLDDHVLNRGAQNGAASYIDPITQDQRTINVFQSGQMSAPQLGERTFPDYVAVQDNQYIDTRLGNVEQTGGTLNVDIAGDISMAAKQTTLFQADGSGSAQSTINWTSSNKIDFFGATMPLDTQLTTTSNQLAGWPTEVELPDGVTLPPGTPLTVTDGKVAINNFDDFKAFNDALIQIINDDNDGVVIDQAQYDSLIAAAANLQTGQVDFEYDAVPQPDDVHEGGGQRTVMNAIGANGAANITAGVTLDVNGANGGVLRAEDGATIVNNGTVNNTNGVVMVLTNGSTGSNAEGAVINSRVGSNAVDVNGSTYTNDGTINQEAGGTAINATNGSDITNNSVISLGGTGTGGSSANVSATGVNAANSTFTNAAGAEIYIGRNELGQDVALNIGGLGAATGVNVTGLSHVVNEGDITIGSLTQGAVGLKVDGATAGSTVDNKGDITVNGAAAGTPRENVGYLVRNAGADGNIKNSGTLTVNGVNGTALKVLSDNGTDAHVISTGTVNVAGDADPASGTRNYGVWVEGTGGGTASADISGPLNLTGNGAIGVHARGDANVHVGDGATPSFSDGTDQIGFFIYGSGASIDTDETEFEVATERSTLFRIEDGAQFDGTGFTITASGIDSKGVVGTGAGTVIDTKGTTFNLTGDGATAMVIEGGATGTADDTTIFNLDAANTIAGIADGQKHGLNGAPVGAIDPATKLTNGADVESAETGVTGFIARNSATVETTGDMTLSGAGSTGLLAEDGGKFIASDLTADINGWVAQADGGDANSFVLSNVIAEGSDGVLHVAADTGASFSATGSDLTGRMQTEAGGTSDVDLTGTRWEMNADSNVTNLTLENTDVFYTRDGNVHKTLTVNGDYSSTDSELFMNTYLGTDGSQSDLLHVEGSTSGLTLIHVENTDGIGEQTLQDGILLVQVDGASDGEFVLDSPFVIRNEEVIFQGAWGYTLQQNGKDGAEDGDWYLRTELADGALITAPGIPIYEAYVQALLGLNSLSSLQQRSGNRYWNQPATGAVFCKDPARNYTCAISDEEDDYYQDSNGKHIDQSSIWGRIEVAHGEYEPDKSTSGMSYDQDLWKLQAGIDGLFAEGDAGKLIGGINAQYGTIDTDVSSLVGGGDISTTAYGVGASLTWYGLSGFYVDGQAGATWYDSDLKTSLLGDMADGNNAFGYALSIEIGQRLEFAGAWALTPQAQLVYSSVEFDDFTDALGADVSMGDGESLKGRAGLALEYQDSWKDGSGDIQRASVYGIANLQYEFLDGTSVDASGNEFETELDPLWGGVGIGGSYNLDNDRYALFGEVSANTSLENFTDSYSFNGNAGIHVSW